MSGTRYRDLRERIIANSVVDGPLVNGEPCWIWIGSMNAAGYGAITMRVTGRKTPRRALAHRLSVVVFHGIEIPAGMQVLHACNRPRCVNPGHLHPGTASENVQECVAAGRHYTPFATALREPGEDDE